MMMMNSEAVPELIRGDERSKRETIELCGEEQHGLHCTLSKGHAGMHEGLGLEGHARWRAKLG